MEKRYVNKQGAAVWMNVTVGLVRTASGNPDYAIAVMEDIGARKASNQLAALRLREIEAIYSQAPVGLLFHPPFVLRVIIPFLHALHVL